MPKPIPAPTIASGIPPDRSRIYFEHSASFKFNPQTEAFDLGNACWLMEAAFAAYESFGNVPQEIDLGPLLGAGYTKLSEEEGGTQFFAIENAEVLIVAFRGTRVEGFKLPFLDGQRGMAPHWGDVITDARFMPRILEPGVFVHRGFFDAFERIRQKLGVVVESALAGGRAVWFCGHSLGAALATLAAYEYGDRVQGLYTFGSPRVGNGSFVKKLLAGLPRVWRFVHHRDVVTSVPPEMLPVASGGNESNGYAHVGELIYISGQKSWEIQAGSAARNTLGTLAADALAHTREVMGVFAQGFSLTDPRTWPVVWDAVSDHAPIYYANKIFNALEDRA